MTLVDDLRDMLTSLEVASSPGHWNKAHKKLDEIDRFITALIETADAVEEMLIAEKMK